MYSIAAALLLATGLSGPLPDDGELLPIPRPIAPEQGPLPAPWLLPPGQVLPPFAFYRPNPYDVWQRYGVTRSGNWRARVIDTPDGAFYLYNGEPYNLTSVKDRNHRPNW